MKVIKSSTKIWHIIVLLGAISLSNVGAQSVNSKNIDLNQLQLAAKITSAITTTHANYVISPLNLDVALSTIYRGVGDARCLARLRTLMGTGTIQSVIKKREYIIKYLDSDNTASNLTLSFLNAIFYDQNTDIMPKYKSEVEYLYRTNFKALNFEDKIKASRTINNMISSATNGMIQDGVDANSIDPQAQIMSVNVLYFKALWKEPFGKRHMQTFFGSDGFKKEIPMMTATTNISYYGSTDFKFELISKPYGANNLGMVLILPNADSSVEKLERNLLEKPYLIGDALRDSYSREIEVTMPVILMEETLDMTEVLKAKKINCIFNGGLKKLNLQPMSISKMTHKVKFETDENGSRGAAVTISEVVFLMLSTSFVVNRPYMFMVVDMDTGFIIFMGKQSKPN